jgi:hypothetical protein
MQLFYLVVRTYLRLLVVAGPGVAFLVLALSANLALFVPRARRTNRTLVSFRASDVLIFVVW